MRRAITNKHIILLAVVILAFFVPLLTKNPYYLHVLTTVSYTIILTASFRVILNTGQLSLAHAAFVGIGAYSSALLVKNFGISFFLALPLAGIIGGVVAILVGYPTLRIKGVYFILVTFGLVEIFRILLNNFWKGLLGGPDGILGIPPPSLHIPHIVNMNVSSKVSFYYLALCLMVASLVVIYRIEKSVLGKIFFAIRQADSLVESVGIDIMKYKILAFAIGCFFASVTGSFYAHYLSNVSSNNFTFWFSTDILVAVIIGGSGSFAGPILGAVMLTMISEALAGLRMYENIFFGISIILIVLFAPQGIAGVFARVSSIIDKRWSRRYSPDKGVCEVSLANKQQNFERCALGCDLLKRGNE